MRYGRCVSMRRMFLFLWRTATIRIGAILAVLVALLNCVECRASRTWTSGAARESRPTILSAFGIPDTRQSTTAVGMKNPTYPGHVARDACLEPLGLSVTEGAKVLGVTRQALNNVVNGKAGISAEMAIRLEKAFGGGAETWLRLQAAYDLAQAERHAGKIKVRRVKDLLIPA